MQLVIVHTCSVGIDWQEHNYQASGAQRAIQRVIFAHIISVNAWYYKEICAIYNLVKIHARGWQARCLHTRKSTSLTRPYQEIYVPYI